MKKNINWLLGHEYLLVFLASLLLSIAIWWDKYFFTPDTFFNLGDTVFPLSPASYFKILSSSWIPYEIGSKNLYPVFGIFYLPLFLLSKLHFPLWIINRFWLVVPTALVGCSAYYLYRSIFSGKYSFISGLTASAFAMLPPDYSIIPLWYFSLSGLGFALGALIRGLNATNNKTFLHALIISLGISLLTANPRYLYLAIAVILIYLLLYFFRNKRFVTKKTIIFLFLSLIITLIVNSYWIIPMIQYHLSGSSPLSTAFASESYGKDVHRSILLQYRVWSNPLWISRLMISGPFPGLAYMKQIFIYVFSFLLPVLILFSLMLVKNKSFFPIKIITLLFLFFASAMHFKWSSKMYLFLWDHFPGFAVLNTPRHWIAILGVLYSVSLGALLQKYLTYAEDKKVLFLSPRTNFVIKVFILAVYSILIFVVYGGGLLIGVNPEKNIWGNAIYGNHIAPAKIPKEYFELNSFFSKTHSQNYRILNIPPTGNAYVSYSWWHYFVMPEVISNISSIPVLGASANDISLVSSAFVYLKGNDPTAFEMLDRLGVKFIVLHKDYYRIQDVFNPNDWQPYKIILDKSAFLKKLKENDYFVVYEAIKNPTPFLFLLKDNTADNGNKNKSFIKNNDFNLLSFNGNNYIHVRDSSSLRFSDKFTISCWIYLNEDSVKPQGILTKWAGSGGSGDDYGLTIQNNKLWFFVGLNSKDIIPSLPGINAKEWYHIGLVFDKNAKDFSLFLNGIPEAQVTFPQGNIISSDTPVLIGANTGFSPNSFFNGFITNLQIYGDALNIYEIEELNNAGLFGNALPNKNLKAWWITDGSNIAGQKIQDLSGNNNEGKIIGPREIIPVREPLKIIKLENRQKIMIPFRKISETEYVASVKGYKDYYLFLNQHYDPQWQCWINRKMINTHSVSESGMNKWYIGRNTAIEAIITFRPQIWFNVGFLITGMFFLVLVIILFIRYLKIKLYG